MVKLDKKQLENELDLAYDLLLANKYGNTCNALNALGVSSEYDNIHCGGCD